jgi:transcriptional regulator with XRE-family HTH domain
MPPRIGYQKNRERRRTFIREWREFRNLTQATLGERLGTGTSASMISRIESGVAPYTQDTLEGLADALGTDPASLLMRNPLDKEAIWSILDKASQGERQMIADIAKTIVGSATRAETKPSAKSAARPSARSSGKTGTEDY